MVTINEALRDYVIDGVPSSGAHKVKKADLRAVISGIATGSSDGLYDFIPASNAGGTPNAIQATTDVAIPDTPNGALIALPIAAANTTSSVTVSFNGSSPVTVKTSAGNDPAVGGLTAGMIIVGYVSGSTFRLLSDQASAAIVAAAEAAQAGAEAEANRAADYASLAASATGLVNFPTIAALVADATLSYSAGSGLIEVAAGYVVAAQGFRYVVAAAGASDHQITTAGGVKLYQGEPTTGSKSANYTAQITDQGRVLSIDASSSARFVTLPAASAAGNGFRLVVQKIDASSNTVTIDAHGAETINGQQTYVLLFRGQTVALICDGAGWRVMAGTEIFEVGVTPTGDYIKYVNGWMTATLNIPFTGVATNSAAGSIFMSPGISPGKFPVPFVGVPSVQHSGKPGGVNGWTIRAVEPTAADWGTYRTASYETDANTAGTLMLTATGRWAGSSAGAGTLILNGDSTDESFIVARRGTNTIMRGFRWTSAPFFQATADQYPVFSLTSDAVSGTIYRSTNDDMAPYLVNGAHRGGMHSLFGCRLNAFAHGKTQADIGSLWSDGTYQYVLLRIMSVNQLFVARRDADVDAPTGPYTHISGASNTAGFTCSLSVREPFYPMIANRTISVKVDEAPVTQSTGLWNYSDRAEFTETYDVLDRSEVLAWFIANGSGGGLNVTGNPLFSVVIRYVFDAEGNLTIHQDFTAKQSITINRLYGFQMQLAAATGFYVPKTTPFSHDGTTLDYANIEDSVTTTTDVVLDTTNTLAGGLYLDRAITFNGNNGLATGFLPIEIADPAGRRSAYVTPGYAGISIASYGKMYLSAVSKGNHTLTAGQKYSFTGYRNPVLRDANRTAVYPVRSTEGDFLYADWHDKNATDPLPIPADYVGRSFTIVEKSSNVTVSAGVLGETLSVGVSAAGSYGYLVLKLT